MILYINKNIDIYYIMDPKIWGPPAWIFLHCITIGHSNCPTPDNKQNIKDFFENLHKILPCKNCKSHFKNYIGKNPLTEDILNSREKLFMWSVDVRNSINTKIGKKSVSYDAVLAECINHNSMYIIHYVYISIIIFLVIILFILYMKYKYGYV